MPVKREESGRRSVEMVVEVPGTPEQVWHAIATGPGITSWFAPTEVEQRAGGALVFHLGPGMDSPGIVTAWEPLSRFAYEERDWGPGAPPLATEMFVEARSGGTCVIRMVHSLFASTDDWDGQLESFEAGWPPFFHVLRLYLAHFAGQPCAGIRLMGEAPGSEPEAWDTLARALGLAGATRDERRSAPAGGAPPLAGTVEQTGAGKHPHVLVLRLDEPAPGVALISAYTWGGKVHAAISFYLYGDQAADVAARDEPLWQGWMGARFPSVGQAGNAA